ncbi:MAG: T9SS type A sorting domain-containing protein [Bacteroidetes bacterium]|nr:T9SS type A sorting domain-containing protein [Bacteroidota bacterium]
MFSLRSLLLFALANFLLHTFSFAQNKVIAGGGLHSLAVCSDGIVRVWGANYNGQLGDSTLPNTAVPMQINSLSGIISVAAGACHSLALKNDGTVWAWGRNQVGQLGDGTTNTNACQCKGVVQVSGLSGIIAIDAANHHSHALKNDGTVWSWGLNTFGQLGDSTTINKSSPVQVKGLTGIIAIATGNAYSLAVKNDGTVWAWGLNNNGQLGDGTTIDKWTPVLVSSLTGITAIAAGTVYSIALKNDGTVWAWGNNLSGAFGNGTNTNSSVPIQVNTGISAIAAGSYDYSLFLKKDSTVWACGDNTEGQLGDGTTTNRWNPVQSGSLNSIIAIAAGDLYHSLAMKKDSTLWAWGYNVEGGLGDGTFSTTGCGCKPSPVQVIGGVCTNTAGVNEIAEQENILLYPNPTNGVFTVSGLRSTIFGLNIYNIMGEKVTRSVIPNAVRNLTIDISNQANGIYFLQVNTIEKIYTAKIIIQH